MRGYDHSATAAILGFCQCEDCVASVPSEPLVKNTDDWHLWTIRSPNSSALREHRNEMVKLGFHVGPFEISDGSFGIPKGWLTFNASIPKGMLSDEEYTDLGKWDREFGE